MPISLTTGRSGANVDSAMSQVRQDKRHLMDLKQREKENARKAALEAMRQRQAARDKAMDRQTQQQQFQQQRMDGFNKLFAGQQHAAGMQDAAFRNKMTEQEANNKWQEKVWERGDEEKAMGRSRTTAEKAYGDMNTRMAEITSGTYSPEVMEALGPIMEEWEAIRGGWAEGLESDPVGMHSKIQGILDKIYDPAIAAGRLVSASDPLVEIDGHMVPKSERDAILRERIKKDYERSQATIDSSDRAFSEAVAGFKGAYDSIMQSNPGAADKLFQINQSIKDFRTKSFVDARKDAPQRYMDRQSAIMSMVEEFAPEIGQYTMEQKNPWVKGRAQGGGAAGGAVNPITGQPTGGAAGGAVNPITGQPIGGASGQEMNVHHAMPQYGMQPPQQMQPGMPPAQPGQQPAEAYAPAAQQAAEHFQESWKKVNNLDLTPQGVEKRGKVQNKLDDLKEDWHNGEIENEEYYAEMERLAKHANATEWNDHIMPPSMSMEGPAIYKAMPDGTKAFQGFDSEASHEERMQWVNKTMVPNIIPSPFGGAPMITGWHKFHPDGSSEFVEAPPDPSVEFNMKSYEQASRAQDERSKQIAAYQGKLVDADVQERSELRQGVLSDAQAKRDSAFGLEAKREEAKIQQETEDRKSQQAVIQEVKKTASPKDIQTAKPLSKQTAVEGAVVFVESVNGSRQYYKIVNGQGVPVGVQLNMNLPTEENLNSQVIGGVY